MSLSIAFSGKGGTGKTTLSGLLVKYLLAKNKTPVLVVDADPNYNLNEVLGVEVEETLGEIREQMKQGNVPPGMTKDRFMDTRLEEAIIETKDFDLIVMGQPEGEGCYCAANNLLSGFLQKLSSNYPYIVMDNEAGMEHISRLTTNNVDYLLIVSDPSRRGVQAAVRIHDLALKLKIGVGRIYLILNNLKQDPPQEVLDEVEKAGLEILGYVYEDQEIQDYDRQGKPTMELALDNPAVKKAFSLFDKIVR